MWKVFYITWKGAHDYFWICAKDYDDAVRIASTIQGVETIEKIVRDDRRSFRAFQNNDRRSNSSCWSNP